MAHYMTLVRKFSMNISLYVLASSMSLFSSTVLFTHEYSSHKAGTSSGNSILIVATAESNSDSPKVMQDRGSGR